MKKLALLLLMLSYFAAVAQHPLSQGRRSSFYEYLYEISNEETLQIYKNGVRRINASFLHTLKDSFPHDKGVPDNLPPGNYLRVFAENDRLQTVFMHIPYVYAKIGSNNHDLFVILHDAKGNLIKDAEVKLQGRTLHFEAHTGAWWLAGYRNASLLRVYYKGMLNCIPLQQSLHYRRKKLQQFLRKLNFVKAIRRKQSRKYYRYQTTPYENRHTGYIVFSKPIYKPGDTLKFKAYITDKKGKPVDRPLLVRLSDRDFIVDTILTTLQPYAPGGYSCDVALSSGMDIDLDETYMISLETLDSRKYDLNNYNGDLDDDEYAAKRKIFIKGQFKFEEYELNALHFTARTDKKSYTNRENTTVYLQAKDENDLPVMDGQIQLFVTKPIVTKHHATDMFIPDTLWSYTGPMDALGETKVTLPDSIFPRADLLYQIDCIFTNSNNERQTETLSLEYHYNRGSISFDLQADSLHITPDRQFKTDNKVYIYGVNDNDTIETYLSRLPVAIKINPFLSAYRVESENAKGIYYLKNNHDILDAEVSWHHDTAVVYVTNPHKLPFWYTAFDDGRAVHHGYGDTLTWTASTRNKKQCELHLNYIWGNQLHSIPVYLIRAEGNLNVAIDAPATVYPGQTTKITVNVKDKYLEPVADADVTAYAYTSRFSDEAPPRVPSFTAPYRRGPNYYELGHLQLQKTTQALPFQWEQHSRRMGLDTMLYFRFTHPSPVFINTEPARDGTTQVAAFVFARGSIQPVHILYVDGLPVYCSMTDPVQHYSITVPAGKHTISMRTQYQRITLDTVIAAGVKTFISIDSAIHQQNVIVEKMPKKLTAQEIANLEKYMIRLENTFGNYPTYIKQESQIFQLKNIVGNYRLLGWQYKVGPLTGANASLVSKNDFTQDFTPEPDYVFQISKGLIKQKQTGFIHYYDLHSYNPDTSLAAQALTETLIDSLLQLRQDDNLRNKDIVRPFHQRESYKSRLVLRLEHPDLNPTTDVLRFLFFRYDDPSFTRSFKGHTTEFRSLDTGYYRLLVLLTGNRYFVKDSILLKDNHLHYSVLDTLNILPNDSLINNLEKRMRQLVDPWFIATEAAGHESKIAESFNETALNMAHLTRVIGGIVVDTKGDPLPGATIILRGTRSATATDVDGKFSLPVTSKGTLNIMYVGFEKVELVLNRDDFYKITMTESSKQLNEVVVTASGIHRQKRSLGYATSLITTYKTSRGYLNFSQALAGKAAGARVTAGNYKISDISLTDSNDTTTIAADEMDPQLLSPPSNSLRTNFRDGAFWQPRLRTDANGKASFDVTFPDDITNWKTFAIAITGKRQSGIQQTFIRSFKSLSGNLGIPTFTVEGDSVSIITKALNYTQESITATHTFSMNDSVYKSRTNSFKNAFIDTVSVLIPETSPTDSMSFKYEINKEGYVDGEQRKIPVEKRGSFETTGMFAALYDDTTLVYTPLRNEPLQIHAESALLPVLMDEITQLQQYKYLCSEQLASKLKAYLLEKKICTYLKKDFRKEKDISNILKRLNDKKTNGLWGWWEKSPVSLWISRHVIEALLMAQELGYKTDFNKQVAIDYFVYELNSGKERDSIGCMQLLANLGGKIDYRAYTDHFIAQAGINGYDTIRLAALQRSTGQPLNLSPILSRQKNTAFGNAYWGKESYDLFDNSIQRTLQVYQLLRKAGGYETILQRIRGYFLEQRKDGHWRNTYESSLILETILPDILEDESKGPVSLSINGTAITQFPYTDTLLQPGKISISKQGKRPIYFTAYQQYFNREPEKISGLFTVSSAFGDNGMTQQDLKAGVPVTLKVEVTAQKHADYVLVEIPIPAGCSYNSKSQSWASHEVHREHFKDRVSIFCSRLEAGKHTFYVSLLPRYSGRYSLNPAKAEMQYFPVFMGREALKKVNIQ
ncbi:carboxypeptidase-like regulatory domain-containing protein [Chitinophaga filiformis]|uniref:alpha-2-macroglobulin family protein n=1 Tax=Chitinophaga filiformis TaxID=104663 RepID=UPI001F187130|nr:alpha-2-macroglobulin family protein [Chitinophaga filiformis]MCF6408048.1 carboxypeptidase-like regulatory domain-containing protein [Chitinophaga filiformis]